MIAMFWKFVVSLLVWLSADASAINAEPARCAAAVAAARAAVVDQGADRDRVEGMATQPGEVN
jgi:hypothetical protein